MDEGAHAVTRAELHQGEPGLHLFGASQIGPTLIYLFLHVNKYPRFAHFILI